LGTIQEWILGLGLYAFFVSPTFDIADMSVFPKSNASLSLLIGDAKKP
jgi:hypothetical protein